MALTAKQRCLRGISGVLCAGPHQFRPACGPLSCSPPDTSPSRSRKEGGPAERQGTAQLREHALLLGGRGTPRGWLWWPGVASSLQGRGGGRFTPVLPGALLFLETLAQKDGTCKCCRYSLHFPQRPINSSTEISSLSGPPLTQSPFSAASTSPKQ